MSTFCGRLHEKFAEVRESYARAVEEQEKFLEGKSNQEKALFISKDLDTKLKEYEDLCKTSCKLPDGRAIWATDYIALENLATLNELDINSILDQIPADGIDKVSTRLLKLKLISLQIKELGQTLLGLSKLTELNLSCCNKLTTLGDSLGKLVNLKVLDLGGCKRLTSLDNSLGKLVNLTELKLWDCTGINSLGDSLFKLVNLTELDLRNCHGLKSLRNSLDELVNLTLLDLWGCPAGRNAEEVKSLRNKFPNCKIDT